MALKYQCNCPDSVKSQNSLVNTPYFSHSINRNWGSSEAGKGEGHCKHEWATRIVRNEVAKGEIPTDIPTLVSKDEEQNTSIAYQPGYRGNDFGSKSFGVGSVRKFKGG